MKKRYSIISLIGLILISACTGSKKSFKAAERLEKQGLVNEAAGYYLESLQRKPTNVDARLKLISVGQKYASNLSSEFFRNFNTQQLEASLESFERLKDFTSRTAALDVVLDYPKSYNDDYQKMVGTYCLKNYNMAYSMVNQKKYADAINYINNVKKYDANYKTTQQLETTASCEPLYQSAIISLENKNYAAALITLSRIKAKAENYKDTKELYELSQAEQTKEFILIQPKTSTQTSEQEIENNLFNEFIKTAAQKFPSIVLINNTPFDQAGGTIDILNNTSNVDLIQAIRKATGADYFYAYDVLNEKEFDADISRSAYTAYNQIKTVKNSTLTVIEYQPIGYNLVKDSRTYSYHFKYKIINAYNNQIVSSQTQSIISKDEVEYNEFVRKFNGNINTLFPYNPEQTSITAQYNPKNWRDLFTARSNLKSFDDLKNETYNKTIDFFTTTVSNNIK